MKDVSKMSKNYKYSLETIIYSKIVLVFMYLEYKVDILLKYQINNSYSIHTI